MTEQKTRDNNTSFHKRKNAVGHGNTCTSTVAGKIYPRRMDAYPPITYGNDVSFMLVLITYDVNTVTPAWKDKVKKSSKTVC